MSGIRDCLKYPADVNPFWSDSDLINKERKIERIKELLTKEKNVGKEIRSGTHSMVQHIIKPHLKQIMHYHRNNAIKKDNKND